jgi:hypothetical protein
VGKFIEDDHQKALYAECHKRFSYDAETGLLARKLAVMNGGKPHNMPNCKVGDPVGGDNGKGYFQVRVGGKQHLTHRLIWLMVTGSMPKEQIDHINGIKSDNRLANLREATASENNRNVRRRSDNASGFKGVSASGIRINPYKAQIQLNGKNIYLGNFKTPELAYEAYCHKAKELHGEFARLNEVQIGN